MKYNIAGKEYYLPTQMNDFQRNLYIHLANWKRERNAERPGYFKGQPNDLIFTDDVDDFFHIYRPVHEKVKDLRFKKHKFFRHMASSQAACINLFVPFLQYPELAAKILRKMKPDLFSIATGELDCGYQLEYWGEQYTDNPKGFLNDHNPASGTDADIAIAYHDQAGDLNLWLIEHKLSEKEFTSCAAAVSSRRNPHHRCKTTSDIYNDPSLCYYQSGVNYFYWETTKISVDIFQQESLKKYPVCPFMGGMNQLWRNQLLARAFENSPVSPFKKVYFSVVHHPENRSLSKSIEEFVNLTNNTDRFFVFTSDELLESAIQANAPELQKWANWYRELYFG